MSSQLGAARGAQYLDSVVEREFTPEVARFQPTRDNAAAAVLGRGDWPEPKPLPVGLPAVAEFELALLPDSLRPWAGDICDRVQCPPDYVGATLIAALGSVIGRKVGIRPQEQTDWTEYANQWAMIIGRPGVMKSPAMDATLAPLKRLAAKASETYDAEVTAYDHRAKLAKIRADAGEKAARQRAEKDRSADLGDLLYTEPIPDPPTLRRYIANDTSGASLGELLRQNPNGTLVFRDELVSLLKGLDREDNASERGFYLTGWTGKSSYTFDRIGRGMNLFIPAVCISLMGSTQPGRIAEYVNAAVRGGSGDDGLLQRFGLTVWPDTASDWRDVDRWPDSDARQTAHRVFEELDQLSPTERRAQQEDDGEPPFLRLNLAARELFRDWRTELETRLRANELHPAMEAHLAKYRKLVPSLALVLHLADRGTGPVTESAILKALAWSEYLETHAGRLYASATSPEVAAAKAILAKLRQGHLLTRFAARDVYRKGWANLSDRRQVEDGLLLLVDFDWLVVSTVDTSGRWATVYEANPRLIQP